MNLFREYLERGDSSIVSVLSLQHLQHSPNPPKCQWKVEPIRFISKYLYSGWRQWRSIWHSTKPVVNVERLYFDWVIMHTWMKQLRILNISSWLYWNGLWWHWIIGKLNNSASSFDESFTSIFVQLQSVQLMECYFNIFTQLEDSWQKWMKCM